VGSNGKQKEGKTCRQLIKGKGRITVNRVFVNLKEGSAAAKLRERTQCQKGAGEGGETRKTYLKIKKKIGGRD